MKRVIIIEIEGEDEKAVLHAARTIRNVAHIAGDSTRRNVRDMVFTDDPYPRYHLPRHYVEALRILDEVREITLSWRAKK